MIAKEIILSYIRSDLSVLPVWGENAENVRDQKAPCTSSWLTYQSNIIKEEDVDKVFGRSAAIGIIVRRYRDWETDRKSTRLNSSHLKLSRMPSSA